MSEQSQGPGWWQASDGKWYPPQDRPAAPPAPEGGDASQEQPVPTPTGQQVPPAQEPVPPPTSEPEGKRSRKGLLVGLGVLVVLLLVVVVALVVTGGDDDDASTASGDASTSTTAEADQEEEAERDGGDGDDGDGGGADISDEMPSDDITLADDVVVVDSEGGDRFGGYSDDGTALLVDAEAEGVDELEEGDVLLLSGITVVRVSQIDEVEDGLAITGEPVTLPEVIEDGELSWEDVEYDPEQMRLFVYDDPEGTTLNSVGVQPASLPAGTGTGPVLASPAAALPTETVSGSLPGDLAFRITHEPQGGSGHHLLLEVESSGDVTGTVTVDVELASLATSGGTAVEGGQVRNFDFELDELAGDATITTDLRATKNTASLMTPAFLKVPFGIEFPALVGGIPFTLSLKSTIQVQLSMAMANGSLGGRAEISFGGDAGMQFRGGELTVSGQRIQEAPDLLRTVQGNAAGPVGVVVTAELPKVGFGFGFLQTGAGVFLSSGMVVSQSILPPPPACTGTQVAYVLAAGVEASFLGKEIDLGRKAVVDERWDYTLPRTAQCVPELRGG